MSKTLLQTLTTIRIFFLAMATFPHVQERAQAELLRVIGPDRLPSLADRQDLPYVDAVLKECFRWHPILPLALPHQSVEEDEYRGWRIPKGSVRRYDGLEVYYKFRVSS